jgi:hypothetical protein
VIKRFKLHAAAASVALALGLAGGQAAAAPLALELALLVDVSGSVDATEYNLQKNGYVLAFQSAAIQNAIIARGGIAVQYIEWSSANEQAVRVSWTVIDSAATANAFATTLSGLNRAFNGATAPGSAINFAVPLFNNGIDSDRQVIDVSGDGEQNDGANTAAARTAAINAGIDAINGLAIGGAGLLAWYQANIVGGPTGFALQADSFADFASTVETKIGREINQVPEPGTLALLGLAVAGFAAFRRRQAA